MLTVVRSSWEKFLKKTKNDTNTQITVAWGHLEGVKTALCASTEP